MKQTVFTVLLLVIVVVLSACGPIQSPTASQPEMAADEPLVTVVERTSDVPRIALEEAKVHFDNDSAIFIDSRSEAAYEQLHIAGALHLSTDDVATWGDSVAVDQMIITYCT